MKNKDELIIRDILDDGYKNLRGKQRRVYKRRKRINSKKAEYEINHNLAQIYEVKDLVNFLELSSGLV